MARTFNIAVLVIAILLLPMAQTRADGGYFSRRSVAVSADQRAIIIKNNDEVSMTLSTGYTGDGGDFGWIIPTPVPPGIDDVFEAGQNGERAFQMLDEYSAPEVYVSSGCFLPGTEVHTADGPRAIETIQVGARIYAQDMDSGKWVLAQVYEQGAYQYKGDIVTVQIGSRTIQATGNHPFYVLKGDRLASRPEPQEISEVERIIQGSGRWVEARDLAVGDVLKTKNRGNLAITRLSSRDERALVYHLQVDPHHNYAVHQSGVLVHNGGSKDEAGGPPPAKAGVRVYGTITLEHYEVSILGAGSAAALLNWLAERDYQVDPSAERILDSYIRKQWVFVAVKLNPGEKRVYENEYLPPLTIRYEVGRKRFYLKNRSDRLVFPLRISAVSTSDTVGITLYVIADSTVQSSNMPTAQLSFQNSRSEWFDPEQYLDSCIEKTLADLEGGLVVLFGGQLRRREERQIINRMLSTPFPEDATIYLTRLETRMDPASMTEDIELELDRQPINFRVRVRAEAGYGTELIMAAENGDTGRVRSLLAAGSDLEARDENGLTALMWAIRERHRETAELLLAAGADVNARDLDGQTTLMWAAYEGHLDIAQALLRIGADAEGENDSDATAMQLAACSGQVEIVELLLAETVDPTGATKAASLMSAASNGHTGVVSVLLEAGVDVDVTDKYGRTALIESARLGHRNVVETLLDSGANVNARTRAWGTALTAASWRGNVQTVRLLLEAGADPNIVTAGRKTALINAASQGHPEVVRLLLEAGANVRDRLFKAALKSAREKNHFAVVDLLVEAGTED